MDKTPRRSHDFPDRIVYLGNLCELVGIEGDRAEYVHEYDDQWRISFSWDLFGYYATNGLIEPIYGA